MTQSTLSNLGTHSCNITRQAEDAISRKYLLGKLDSSGQRIRVCDGSDFPIGIITDEAEAPRDGEEAIVNVALLGSPTTLQAVASAPIEVGTLLVPADDGKVQPLPSDTGNYYVIGFALTRAAADDDLLEFMSCVPQMYAI
ncbi:MAG: DUF2190 family protein [Puniceicoccales bacterium]|jgi:hypothetical protein|nr:DUF2190 family protein [Puniceicoccales bacterium]